MTQSAVRPGTEADLAALAEIQRRSPQAAQWPEIDLRRALNGQRSTECVLAEHDGQVAGFLLYQQLTSDEIEIQNLAVHPEHRCNGIGTLLVKHVLALSPEELFLEVRAGNEVARCFYTQAGFDVVGSRKAYYRHPQEDALVMRWTKPLQRAKRSSGN